MKLLLISFLAAGIATAASAGNSDRYNDLRFDSAAGHVSDTSTGTGSQDILLPAAISSRSEQSEGTSYPYINPYGVGPDNDSR